jgi:redox-sensing transcriptional repressor
VRDFTSAAGGRYRRPEMNVRHVPDATVARLPQYLRSLVEEAERGASTISSERLADLAGVNAAKVRKDLSHIGSLGTRGVGYDVEFLVFQIRRELGLTQDWAVGVVGVGNLGRALAGFGGFRARGFQVIALFDDDPAKIGTEIEGVEAARKVQIGIIATPAEVAQEVADRWVEAGVSSILSFAPAVLHVPDGVVLRKVDLSMELQILSFHSSKSGSGAASSAS